MRETIDSFYRAMQAGPEGAAAVAELFAEDGVYVEPFSGGTHAGQAAVRSFLAGSQGRLPDVRITVDRIDVDGDIVETSWTCESSAFAKPSRGRDRFTVRNGKIARLETQIDEQPELRQS